MQVLENTGLRLLLEEHKDAEFLKHYLPLDGSSEFRIINLKPNETLRMHHVNADDLFTISKGSVNFISPSSKVNIKKANKSPYIVPKNQNWINIEALESSVVVHLAKKVKTDIPPRNDINNIFRTGESNKGWVINAVKSCPLLRILPLEDLELLLEKMEIIYAPKNSSVIREGDFGEIFYMILTGKAEYWHSDLFTSQQKLIGTFGKGNTFGCYALITGQRHPKTVKMVESGELLTLEKKVFDEIIHKKLVKRAPPTLVKSMLETGFELIDVRYEEEYLDKYIKNAKLMPLYDLDKRVNELDSTKKYVVYCHCGNRSAVASMKLRQFDIEAWSLEGGIRDWPYDIQYGVA